MSVSGPAPDFSAVGTVPSSTVPVVMVWSTVMPVLAVNEAAVRSQKPLLVVEPRMICSVLAAWLDTPGAAAAGAVVGEVVAGRGGPDGPMQPANTPAPSTAPDASKPR